MTINLKNILENKDPLDPEIQLMKEAILAAKKMAEYYAKLKQPECDGHASAFLRRYFDGDME